MSKLEIIEAQLKELNEDELRSFRQWFAESTPPHGIVNLMPTFASGRLDKLAEKALLDHEDGKSTEL